MDDLVRQESRTAAGPADLDVAVDVGRVEVHLENGRHGGAQTRTAARGRRTRPASRRSASRCGTTRPRPAGGRSASVRWRRGSAPSGAAPDTDDGPASAGADAVRAAEISWSAPGAGGEAPTLTVRSTTELPLRMVPLVVTVWAPAGSRVTARTGAGDVAVTGRAGPGDRPHRCGHRHYRRRRR